jgi:uncharacterized repeat protein (TIGR01451 family)
LGADLSLTLNGSTDALTGDRLIYAITVANIGPLVAKNVVVTNPVPAGATFISAEPPSTGWVAMDQNQVIFILGDLQPGESQVAIMTLTYNDPGTFINSASVGGTSTDSDANNNSSALSTTVVVPALNADMVVALAGPSLFTAGHSTTYSLSVTNMGPAASGNGIVSITLPAEVNVTSFVLPDGFQYSLEGTKLNINFASLQADGYFEGTLQFTVASVGSYSMTAVVTGESMDPNIINNESTASFTVEESANVPPEINLALRPDTACFFQGTAFMVVASVFDSDGSVTNVEFLVDGKSVGSSSSAPFEMEMNSLEVGKHAITAIATDDRNGKTESLAVNISIIIRIPNGRVGVVRYYAHAEIDTMVGWLGQMKLSAEVLDQPITLETIKDYELIIWDDLGAIQKGIMDQEVMAYNELFNQGVPMYFIGDDLASVMSNLSSQTSNTWRNLIHLDYGDTAGSGGLLTLVDSSHPVINGIYGQVTPFSVQIDPDKATRSHTGELLLATVSSSDVLLAFESPKAAGPRSVTQNFLATGSEDVMHACLFKNSVAWLLRLTAPPEPCRISSAIIKNGQIKITWTGGNGRLQKTRAITANPVWQDVGEAKPSESTDTLDSNPAYYRVLIVE